MAFDALRPMPIDQLALRSKIAERSGEHIYFPNGQIYPFKSLGHVKPRPQIFVGWTTRFFLYLPPTPADHKTTDKAKEAEYEVLERSELRAYFKRNFEWTVGIRIARGRICIPHKRYQDKEETVTDIKVPVPEGSYFSVALRAKDKTNFAVLYNEKELLAYDVNEVPGWDWLIQFKTGIQTLLSWHTTDELNYTNHLWTNFLRMETMWWPTGTVATFTVFVEKVPTKTTIKMEWYENPEVDFSLKNVKKNMTLRFTVTLSAQKTYVTSDFSGNKVVGLSPSSQHGPHHIEPEFPTGLLVHKIETVVPSFVWQPGFSSRTENS